MSLWLSTTKRRNRKCRTHHIPYVLYAFAPGEPYPYVYTCMECQVESRIAQLKAQVEAGKVAAAMLSFYERRGENHGDKAKAESTLVQT